MPKIGSAVSTPQGLGKVVGYITIESKVKISLDSDAEGALPKIFKLNEIKSVDID